MINHSPPYLLVENQLGSIKICSHNASTPYIMRKSQIHWPYAPANCNLHWNVLCVGLARQGQTGERACSACVGVGVGFLVPNAHRDVGVGVGN